MLFPQVPPEPLYMRRIEGKVGVGSVEAYPNVDSCSHDGHGRKPRKPISLRQ